MVLGGVRDDDFRVEGAEYERREGEPGESQGTTAVKIIGGMSAPRQWVVWAVWGDSILIHVPQFDNQIGIHDIKYYIHVLNIIIYISNQLF